MPQLNPDSFLPQLFWLAITFVTLYFVMARISLPRVSRIREQRANRIRGDLEEAGAMKAQADSARAAYEAALADAKTKAQALGLATREAMKADADARRKAVNDKIAADAERAAAAIETAKQQALLEVRDIAAEAARDIVAKVAGLKLDETTVRAAVDAELKQLSGGK